MGRNASEYWIEKVVEVSDERRKVRSALSGQFLCHPRSCRAYLVSFTTLEKVPGAVQSDEGGVRDSSRKDERPSKVDEE
jgi:hypothetical protein